MKQKLLLSLITLLVSIGAWAELDVDFVFTADGITYKVTSTSPREVQVGTGSFNYPAIDETTTGAIKIPSSVIGSDGIRYSVTSIGIAAFDNCSGLTSVTIPNSVRTIGEGAFSGCSNLTSVTIPNSVINIEASAFEYCIGLTSITIPSSVTSIGDRAFEYCTGLTTITIPNSVTQIGDYMFQDCTGLTSVILPNSLTSIGDYSFFNCNALTSVTIPNSVKSIGYQAFSYCSSLPSITIPNSVTNIGFFAFSGCTGLKSITIPNSVIRLDGTFDGCSSLTSITIPNSVTSIGERTFYDCSGLTSITIPNSVTSIGSYAFSYCNGLKSITIPNSVTTIGEGAFQDCIGLTSAIISNSVNSIGNKAFYDCINLSTINISDNITSIGYEAFERTAWLENYISEGMVYIGRVAYKYYGSMPENTKIVLKEGTLGIAGRAFYGCYDMKSISIPNSVKSIGEEAFYNCDRLTSVIIPDGVTSIKRRTFAYCMSLTNVTIPRSVTSIGNEAFCDCYSLKSLTIPDNVCSIGENAFESTGWLENQPDGLVYAGRVAYKYKGKMPSNTEIILKEGTLGIADKAFYECYGLNLVSFPNSLKIIGSNSFYYCYLLKSVVIPNGVTSIGDYAFHNCLSITSVTIPNSMTNIGTYAFFSCNDLADVYCFANNVPDAADDAFSKYGIFDFPETTLHIPAGTKEKYESKKPWKYFDYIVEMDDDKYETVPVGKALVAGYSSDKALDFTGSDVTTWIATGFRDGKIMLSKVDVVPANTGIYVKSTKAGEFDVPVTTEKAYYVNMFQPVVTAKTVQPTETVDGVTYQTLSFALSQSTGNPAFFPNTAEKAYSDNKMYLRLPEWVVNGATGAADSGTEPVTIGTLGVAGFSSNRNLDFTDSDVEAWIATGFKGGNVLLSRIYAVPAGTGVYVKSKKTLTTQTTFQIPVTTELPYYVNMFVGLPDGGTVHPTETVDGVTMQTLSFAKSQSTGKPAFFPNTADKTYGAGKMYLRLPADLVNSSDAARGLNFVFEGDELPIMGETTGISDASHLNDKGQMINDGSTGSPQEKRGGVYNLNGQRVQTSNFKVQTSKLKKGLYIVNGKKVVIK